MRSCLCAQDRAAAATRAGGAERNAVGATSGPAASPACLRAALGNGDRGVRGAGGQGLGRSVRVGNDVVPATGARRGGAAPAGTGDSVSAAGGAGQQAGAVDPLFDDEFDEEFDVEPAGFPDPWEGVNRGVLGFNRRLDRWVLDPVTRGYRKIAPAPVRTAIRHFFDNIGSVPILANDILQLRPRCAGVTLARIVTNTTVGIGGLFDPARRWGLERHRADFGQTVARIGVGSGPYLVLPLLGPTTLRDGTATLVDAAFNPAFWVLGPAQQLTYGGGAGLAARDANFEALMALANSSIDYYAALRNGYYQSRIGQIEQRPSCGCPR
ncbi:MAG: VacJ family lipoprotein [Deltaproteobacteria bacterium]|nr:MAG: VacJ family lipoprotein [Deltaproteobacteria bacterium]